MAEPLPIPLHLLPQRPVVRRCTVGGEKEREFERVATRFSSVWWVAVSAARIQVVGMWRCFGWPGRCTACPVEGCWRFWSVVLGRQPRWTRCAPCLQAAPCRWRMESSYSMWWTFPHVGGSGVVEHALRRSLPPPAPRCLQTFGWLTWVNLLDELVFERKRVRGKPTHTRKGEESVPGWT